MNGIDLLDEVGRKRIQSGERIGDRLVEGAQLGRQLTLRST